MKCKTPTVTLPRPTTIYMKGGYGALLPLNVSLKPLPLSSFCGKLFPTARRMLFLPLNHQNRHFPTFSPNLQRMCSIIYQLNSGIEPRNQNNKSKDIGPTKLGKWRDLFVTKDNVASKNLTIERCIYISSSKNNWNKVFISSLAVTVFT